MFFSCFWLVVVCYGQNYHCICLKTNLLYFSIQIYWSFATLYVVDDYSFIILSLISFYIISGNNNISQATLIMRIRFYTI